MSEPTRETPAIDPEVRTAPAGSGWSRIPDHLGPARTSTVILGVLFLALFALYLYIRPEATTVPVTTGNTGAVVEQPAAPTTAVPETTAPQTTAAPETTTEEPATPTTSAPTATPSPTGTTAPRSTSAPTSTVPSLPASTTATTAPGSPTP
jgi:cytoskeletal protein RodZ